MDPSNPWLNDYSVEPAPEEPYNSGEATKDADRAKSRSRDTNLGHTSSRPSRTRAVGRWAWRRVLPHVLASVALAATYIAGNYWVKHYGGAQESPPVVTPIESSDDLIALRVQVKDSLKNARRHMAGRHPDLVPLLERWNSKAGLYVHGAIPTPPVFIPELRPGHREKFNMLIFEGFGDIELHAFPFVSEDHLYKVAAKCGLPAPQGKDWIVTWSTWRDGPGQPQTTKCQPGGWCVMLTRGCDADTFN